MTFEVFRDDNSHYQDESERKSLGEYSSYEEALAAARQVVDSYLQENKSQHATAAALYRSYTMYGDDPFIIPDKGDTRFSAFKYAKEQCDRLFADQ